MMFADILATPRCVGNDITARMLFEGGFIWQLPTTSIIDLRGPTKRIFKNSGATQVAR